MSSRTLATLRTQALLARAEGNHTQAVALWRQLLDHAPHDWALALELKHDLKTGLHYPDSDPRFRRAAAKLPDQDWLDHYQALYAFHGSDLDAIDTRARILQSRWPQSSRLEAILGDVARQRRDWPEAERAFTRANKLDPNDTECAHRAAMARLYARLAAQPWPPHGPTYAIHVVNLDRNPERMVEIDHQFATAAPHRHRIPAIEGSRLPAAAVARLTADPAAPRGTLGCFLSHAAAWEALLQSPQDCALILEDDVIPLLDLPPTLGGLNLPETWDVVFVNDRLEPRRNPDEAQAFTTQPLAETMRAYPPEDNATGADGYLLSRQGAHKLLALAERDGMAEDVDWRIVAASLTEPEVASIPQPSHARRELQRLQTRFPPNTPLQTHVLHPALIRTVGVSSDREDQNRLTER